MEGNSSLERRCSFNISRGNPVAESTHLNGSSFQWGYSMSLKQRSNSSNCLNDTQNKKSILLSPKQRNTIKIDARVVADIQSKGLASRIVKYHESGTRLTRSVSAHNLHCKPGQFPTVILKKTELPYRATKQELSMIRIPPPEKSAFYGNSVSSLLRSNSVVGLQSKRTEDISRENRPIIHPPPTERDMAPTRSVLDVLKEISRKRINSDGLNADETSKKYCNRAGNDSADNESSTASSLESNVVISTSSQRFKRQRDCLLSLQTIQLIDSKSSPEQAKKRVCSYNNDITSSLSSSLKYKHYVNKAHKVSISQTMPKEIESYETQKSTRQQPNDQIKPNSDSNQIDMRFENLASNLRQVDSIKPITPIPATPCIHDKSGDGISLQRALADHPHNPDRKINMNFIHPTNKPRLTLFNKKYDETGEVNNLNESLTKTIDDLSDFDECVGIPFVKPKKMSLISGRKNPVIERTQKSKLALMLSGLRGELYEKPDADELDSSNAKERTSEENNISTNNIAIVSASKTDTTTTTTLTTVTSSSSSNICGTPNDTNLILDEKTKTISSSPSTSTKMTSPLVGLKLSHPNASTENNMLNIDVTKSIKTEMKSNVPILGGFSFSTTNTNTSAAIQTTAIENISTDIKTTAASTSVSFGHPAQLSSILLNNMNSNKLPTEILSSTKGNTLSSSTICSVNANPNTIKSSSSIPIISDTSSIKPINTFSFGPNVTAPASTSCTPILTLNSSSGFNFSVPTTHQKVSSASSVPIFGLLTSSTGITNTTASNSITPVSSIPTIGNINTTTNLAILTSASPLFTFNTSKQSSSSCASAITTTNGAVSTSSFSFGTNTNTSMPTFGANVSAIMKTENTTSSFVFGSESKVQQSNPEYKNKSTGDNQTGNNIFNSNTSVVFGGTTNLNAPTSTPLFGNSTNSTEKNIFSTSNTASASLFGSDSAKNAVQTFGSNICNTTPSVLDSSSTNNSTPAPFSFGSKTGISQTINGNSSASGGFSFRSNNSVVGGNFGFSSKSVESANTPNTAFGAVSSSQNKNFTFGSAADKSDNNSTAIFGGAIIKPSENTTSSGGFSFGSAVLPKTSTYNFGAGNNSTSSNNMSNNSTTGFTFGGVATSKQTEISTTKPFSFGTSQMQSQQQQQSVSSNNLTSSNIFSSAISKTSGGSHFNFNAGSSTVVQSTTPTSSNIFAPTASNIATGPGDRPIRRATRRLQK